MLISYHEKLMFSKLCPYFEYANFKGNRTLFCKTSEIPYQDPTVRAWSRWSLNEAESLKRNERGRPYSGKARQPFTKCTSGLGCWYCSPLGLSYVIFFSNFNQHLLYIYFRVQNKRSRTFIGFWIFYTLKRRFPCYVQKFKLPKSKLVNFVI